jgi:hypothetical protein
VQKYNIRGSGAFYREIDKGFVLKSGL